jgi:hypothetical protein
VCPNTGRRRRKLKNSELFAERRGKLKCVPVCRWEKEGNKVLSFHLFANQG